MLRIASITVLCLIAAASHGEDAPQVTSGAADSAAAFVLKARGIVSNATGEAAHWKGPQSGPAALHGKTIAMVTEDLRNGGIIGVAQGVREAAAVVGWTLKVFDGNGSAAGRANALMQALAARPDGLILCGADALENTLALTAFTQQGIPIVGWHAGAQPGPIAGTPIAMNVTSDPLQVASLTAMAAVAQSGGHAGVVILTDSRYAIAMAKAKVMKDVILACQGCVLLEVRDVAISASGEQMPGLAKELLAHYGKRWTHTLAINDIYFDYAIAALTSAAVPSDGMSLMSAGDGSASAFLRIRANTYQTATVAEPLNLQGWQVIDELNRSMLGQPASGFVAAIHLVTADNVATDGGARFQYDPDNGYREQYRRIWKP